MLINVYEYNDIKRSTIFIMLSPILCPLAKTAYFVIAPIVFCKKMIFRQMFRSKSKQIKNRFITECSVHSFCTLIVEIRIFSKLHPFN